MRTCKNCKSKFEQVRSNQIVCSPLCAYDYQKKQKAKQWNKEKKERKEKLKTRSEHLNELQVIFNAFIRERDKNEPCISCGKIFKPNEKRDASHYRSVGSTPELRFCEENVYSACVHCNQHLHGNLIEYRKRLVEKFGVYLVDWLESNHEPKHYSIEDIKELKEHYKNETKLIKQSRQGTL